MGKTKFIIISMVLLTIFLIVTISYNFFLDKGIISSELSTYRSLSEYSKNISNSGGVNDGIEDPPLEDMFKNSLESAKPWVMWWWQDGNTTKEGIKEDLEAMSSNGIGGVYLFTIITQSQSSVVDRPAVPLTDYWWEMIRYAAEVADNLGLKIALNACDGWATAAAPEITPELSMQKLVWSETKITGGTVFNEELPQPQTNLGYYRDLAVWAIPLHQSYFGALKEEIPAVTTNVPGVDVNQLNKTDGFITTDKPGWIQYYYKKPLICRSITISGTDNNLYNAFNCQLDISNDGVNWESSFTLKPPLLGNFLYIGKNDYIIGKKMTWN